MFRTEMADIALIGGNPITRLVIANQLRREGVSVFTESRNSKPTRMKRRAIEHTWRGEAGVANVTDDIELAMISSKAVDFARD